MAIIQSLLDQDLYKLTMMQAVLHNFPAAQVRYRFKCRNEAVIAPLADQIEQELRETCKLRFKEPELEFLQGLGFFKSDFIDFLRLFQLDMRFVEITPKGDDLDIKIEGPWLHTIQFEVFTLAIVQEVYTLNNYADVNEKDGRIRLEEKIKFVENDPGKKNLKFADFGTRRRFTRKWHEHVVETLCQRLPNDVFVGTSNVYLAMKNGIKPIGTMAHEYLQAGQAIGPRLRDSQVYMLEKWVQEYRGDLGIALSDVVGFKAFRRDFDLYFSKLYDGCRHDSGDPVKWCEDLIAHYEGMGIDPKTKTAVFSDGLDLKAALEIAEKFSGRINVSFGIGTNLSHDMGVKPLQIVLKMVECNGQPVAKISDSPGKGMCEDREYLSYLKSVFEIE